MKRSKIRGFNQADAKSLGKEINDWITRNEANGVAIVIDGVQMMESTTMLPAMHVLVWYKTFKADEA